MADEQIPTLPKYVPCTWQGQDMACYDLEGMKSLLALEALAQKLQNQSYLDGAIITRYQEVIQDKDKQIDAATKLNQDLLKAYTEQTDQLKTEIEEKNIYKYKPSISLDSGLPYLILGSVAFVAGGFILGYELK